MMADIAAVFHWQRESLEALPIEELFRWHARAIKRYNLMNGIKTDG